MVGSGIPLDPMIVEGFRPMTPTEMEDALKNLDQRLSGVEQILPTLATKEDLLATRADLHGEVSSVKRDLTERIEEVKRHTDLRFEEMKRYTDLRFEEVKRHSRILWEDVRDDIRKVAEGVAVLSTKLDQR